MYLLPNLHHPQIQYRYYKLWIRNYVSYLVPNFKLGTMERLDHGHLHPLLQHPETKISRPWIQHGSPVSHSSKELFEHLILSLLGTSTYVDQKPVLRIRDFYPGSRILIFTHSGSQIQKQQQKRGMKKICCKTFFCRHKFHKLENYFIFLMPKKKLWASFQRIIELFTHKFVTKL
jgi:hypothetical protein